MSTLEIATLALKLVKPVFGPVKKHCSYAFSYKRHMKELREDVNMLRDCRDRIQNLVDAASRNVEDVQDSVLKWLADAVKTVGDAENLLAKESGSTLDVVTRHSIASMASEVRKEIAKLCSAVPLASFTRRTQQLLVSSSNYTSFPSRKPIFEGIMKALTSDGYGDHVIIGIWGMGGVGKTTLVQEVYRQVMERRLFGDDVAMATVTREVNLKKIQEDIAAMLGLKFDREETTGQMASLLDKRLKNTQNEKALIILEDLWEAVNLQDIGIPPCKGVKLVVTSRSQTVLAEMRSAGELVFQLEPLLVVEAHDLFRSTAGEDADESSVGIKLVEKCEGLPISIKALATTFRRNGGLTDWEDELDKQMNRPNDAYSTLELSYHCLKEEELKSLFLACALFGAGSSISATDLIRYSIGSGIFEGIDRVSSARSRLRSLVERLRKASLVLTDRSDCIQMHDVVHEAAIRIAAKERHTLVVQCGSDYGKYPAEELSECTAISLPFVHVDEGLSLSIMKNKFPKLKTFILIGKAESESAELPSKLFEGMEKLNVLDLSEMSFTSSLPSSIEKLVHLTTLCLDCCDGIGEECISRIGGLSTLQVLSFMGSLIKYLPEEIGQLGELRLLDLSKCSELSRIHPGVLRILASLEELYMENGFRNWECNDGEAEPSNATLDELNGLSKLSTLDFHVPAATLVPENFPIVTQLENFRILIGDCWDWSKRQENTLKLKGDSRSILLKGWVQATLDRVEDLYLDGLKGTRKKSVHSLSTGGFAGIKRLHVQNSPLIGYVVQSVRKTPPLPSFVMLETLSLHRLDNLEQVCHGPPPKLPESFSQLKFVRVTNCRSLKNLFCASMIVRGGLPEIEEIEISKCATLTEIMQGDGVEWDKVGDDHDKNNDKAKPCNLRSLKLHKLPEFTTFCNKVNDSRQTASAITSDSNSVATLFHGQVSFPQLESLLLSGLGKLKEIWSTQYPSMEFCHLKSLEVVDCGSLSLCIPSGVVTSLKALESLSIERCSSIQHVFDIGGSRSGTCEEILPHLQKLTLLDLPRLTSIVANNDAPEVITIFRRLKWVRVVNCDSLMNVFSLTTAKHLQNVQTLRIVECKKVEAIFNLAAGNKLDLPMLELLRLEKLDGLATFVCGTQDIACPQLQKILIKECNQMKAFATTSEASVHPPCFFYQKVSLPRLERLVLELMERLEKMWPEEPSIDTASNSFSILRSLRITNCNKLSSSLIPTTLIDKLQKLEEVLVEECESLEVLFDCSSSLIQCEALMLPKLHSLTLRKLTELKYICKGGNSNIPLGLPSLNEVTVSNCKKVTHLFPEATARTLLQVESLEIEECESMQQIVSKQDGEEQVVQVPISFPHLNLLKLSKLCSLKCFAYGGCEFEFLSLKTLHISECTGLKTLIQRPPLDSDRPSFFDDKMEFPNLDQIYLYDIAVHKIWTDHEQPPSDSFSKLKSLVIESCPNLVTVIASSMLRRLENLETLTISNCIELEEIFQMENGLNRNDEATGGSISFEMLTDRSASGTPNIHQVEVSFPKLESLELCGLGKLKEIWSSRHGSSMEFGNLKSLEVVDCGILSICIPSGVVQSLNQLKSLTLLSCSSIQHVFDIRELESTVHDNEEILLLPEMKELTLVDLSNLIGVLTDSISAEQIIFRKLKTVKVEKCDGLMNLFSLKTAQCLDNIFERLSIVECKEMKAIILVDSSPQDSLDFPELKSLKLEELPLLSTFVAGIQDIAGPVCLFSQKVSLPGLEKLCISSLESLEKIWFGELPNQESFSKLCVLRIVGCTKLSSPLIQITRTKKLQSLNEVTVEKCESMNVLFDYTRLHSQYTNYEEFMLPELQILKVQELTELQSIFSGISGVPFSLPRLKEVKLFKCKKLINLFPNIPTAKTLSELDSIKIRECENMEQVVSTVDYRSELRNIDFPQLCSVELSMLDRLHSFVPKNCSVSCPSLVTLSISECSTLKTFIERPAVQDDRLNLTVHSLFDDKAEFPNLDEIHLCNLAMEKVWNTDRLIPADSFSKLKSLKIQRCQNLVSIIPSNMIRRLQSLEKLVAQNCIVLKELVQLEGLHQQDDDEEIGFKKLKVVSSGCPGLDQYHNRISLLLHKVSLE